MDSISKKLHISQAWQLIAALLMGILIMLPASTVLAATSGTWTLTGSMKLPHYNHTATLLQNGQVLVAGGDNQASSGSTPIAAAELYNPATGAWSNTGSLNIAREQHTATLLPSGQVLVAGGTPDGTGALAGAELYNPATGKWTTTGSMNNSRWMFTATLLQNGQVLVAGGRSGSGFITAPVASAELYDPATGKWTLTGSMNVARYNHTATLLQNGQVLVAGGTNGSTLFASAELYNPATDKWTLTGSMNIGRAIHTATLLQNGQVLVAGGNGTASTQHGYTATAELYNPATGKWTLTGSMLAARDEATATLLSNGQVLVDGGVNFTSGFLAEAELYNPASVTWATTGSMNSRHDLFTATLLNNGQVLAAGGYNSGSTISAQAELYTP